MSDDAQMLAVHGYPLQIIAAARHAGHMAAATLAGAHRVTAGAAVIRDNFRKLIAI